MAQYTRMAMISSQITMAATAIGFGMRPENRKISKSALKSVKARTVALNVPCFICIWLHHHSAIDSQNLAGDVACAGAGEESGGVGDVVRFAESVHRNLFQDVRFDFVRQD